MSSNQQPKTSILIIIPVAILFIIATFFNCWMVWYEIYLKPNTQVVHSYFVDDATYNDDGRYFMEVQVFKNCLEVKVNHYIEASLPQKNEDGTYDDKLVIATGVQIYDLSDFYYQPSSAGLLTGKSVNSYVLKNCTFYSHPDGLDSAFKSGGVSLENENKWIWDIGGTLCMIQAKGEVFDWQFLWDMHYQKYDMSRLIVEQKNSFLSFQKGTTVAPFDFSPYFNIKMQGEDGKFTQEVVDKQILTQFTYMNVKVTVNDMELISATQSMFNSFKGNPHYEKEGQSSELYWIDETIYDVNSDDFKYDKVEGGYTISLKSSFLTFIKEFPNVVLNVEINLDNFEGINVLGFSENPFEKLPIDRIKLTSTQQKNFTVFEDYEIETENVTVIKGGDA